MIVERITLEVSALCNSNCLDCARYIRGTDIVNPLLPQKSTQACFDLDLVPNLISGSYKKSIKMITLTGLYGDAITHPYLLELLEEIAKHAQNKIILKIDTNGGIRDTAWWVRLCDTIKKFYANESSIRFALDGIDNHTHQMYRVGVDFDTVLRNAKIVIEQGVHTRWAMIKFNHNCDQIETAKSMSEKIGFAEFKVQKSRLGFMRPVDIEKTGYGIKYAGKKQTHAIEYSQDDIIPHKQITKNYTETDYDNDCKIICDWDKKKEIFVNFDGSVYRCCFLASHKFGGFKKPFENYLEANKIAKHDMNWSYYENKYGVDWNMLSSNSLQDILAHQFFDDLKESWNNKTNSENNPRLLQCSKHCGEIAQEYFE